MPEFTSTSVPERIGKSTGGKMPPVSQAQRRLVYAAASHKGGVGGMPQSVAKEFVATDKPGKLPARKKAKRVGLINQAVR
jgi:hypothetical protein